MKLATRDLTGAALDWAAAIACGFKDQIAVTDYGDGKEECFFAYPVRNDKDEVIHARGDRFKPSTDWAQGGPLTEREWISSNSPQGEPVSEWCASRGRMHAWGPTELIARTRCLVLAKLGPEVDVPEELL